MNNNKLYITKIKEKLINNINLIINIDIQSEHQRLTDTIRGSDNREGRRLCVYIVCVYVNAEACIYLYKIERLKYT